MANVVGIDLGTTNTVVAIVRDGKAEVISLSEGGTHIPSVVCADTVTPEVLLVGSAAKSIMATNPANAVYSTKRLMGMRYFDEELGCPPKQEEDYERFLKVKHELPFGLFPDPAQADELARVRIGERFLKPEDVAELILRKAQEEAEAVTGAPITGAVITTPAYFENKQKAATKRAAEQAGIEVLALMDEPNAAAVSAGYRPDQGAARWVLVFDLGGGTFDVSLLQISKDQDFHVHAKGGNNWLGGDDFDNCLMKIVEEHARQVANPGADEVFELRRSVVKPRVEEAKIALSENDKVVLDIATCASVRPARGGNPRLVSVRNLEITRTAFEEKIRGILDEVLKEVDIVLEKGGPTIRRVIDQVLLIGGSTYIPVVRRKVSEQFPGKVRIDDDVHPMHEVALGAALYADSLARQKEDNTQRPDRRIRDTVERSLGIECVDAKGNTLYEKLIAQGTPLVKAESEYRKFHATRPDYLAIPVYAGEHETATRNRFQGRIRVDISPPVDVGHPVYVRLQVTQDRLIRVQTRVDGRDEVVHEIEWDTPPTDGDEEIEKLEKELQFAETFINQYGDYVEEKQKEELEKWCARGAKAMESKASLEAMTVTKRIRRLVLHTEQVGNQLFQVDQLMHAPALSEERKGQLRDLASQAKALYHACQEDPSPEHRKELSHFIKVFETFLAIAFREAASGRGSGGELRV